MRRILKTKFFSRWALRGGLSDTELLQSVQEIAHGLIDGDLGGGVVKKRVGLEGRGTRDKSMPKSTSARSKKSTANPKPATRSRILGAVHAAALDLHAAGFIDKRRMREYEALCLEPLPEYSSGRIRQLRDRHRVSQAVFAAILNTSLSTVRQWEIGEKRPSGPSVKLLNLLDRKGLQALL